MNLKDFIQYFVIDLEKIGIQQVSYWSWPFLCWKILITESILLLVTDLCKFKFGRLYVLETYSFLLVFNLLANSYTWWSLINLCISPVCCNVCFYIFIWFFFFFSLPEVFGNFIFLKSQLFINVLYCFLTFYFIYTVLFMLCGLFIVLLLLIWGLVYCCFSQSVSCRVGLVKSLFFFFFM